MPDWTPYEWVDVEGWNRGVLAGEWPATWAHLHWWTNAERNAK